MEFVCEIEKLLNAVEELEIQGGWQDLSATELDLRLGRDGLLEIHLPPTRDLPEKTVRVQVTGALVPGCAYRVFAGNLLERLHSAAALAKCFLIIKTYSRSLFVCDVAGQDIGRPVPIWGIQE